MGKGDRKTFRGKTYRGSYGKTRPHAAAPATVGGAAGTVVRPAVRKSAAAKPAAPKAAAKTAAPAAAAKSAAPKAAAKAAKPKSTAAKPATTRSTAKKPAAKPDPE